MNIDLQQLSNLLIQLGIVGGVISAAYKLVDKHIIKKISDLDNRLKTVEKSIANQFEDIRDETARDRVLMEGVRACLRVLNEKGHEGDVERAMTDIDNFIEDQAYKLRNI